MTISLATSNEISALPSLSECLNQLLLVIENCLFGTRPQSTGKPVVIASAIRNERIRQNAKSSDFDSDLLKSLRSSLPRLDENRPARRSRSV